MSDEPIDQRTIAADAAGDYLWDRTGPVDHQVQRLEKALARLRYAPERRTDHDHAPLRLVGSHQPPRRMQLRAAALFMLSISAAFLIAIMLARPEVAGFSITALDGSPRINDRVLAGAGTLRINQWLETGAGERAEIKVADIGEVTVAAHTRLKVVASGERQHRLHLARGRIDAFITAPPRLFVVDTPAAAAVDLGCRYALTVDDQGDGMLQVTLGWVALETADGREVIVPRGARCAMWKDRGPATPHYDDAPAALVSALEQLDAGQVKSPAGAVDSILAAARERDSLTLWHLLRHKGLDAQGRAAVVARLAQMEPIPSGVTERQIMLGDAAALHRWRDRFIWSPAPPMTPFEETPIADQ